MRFCKYCGAGLPENLKFCPNCGKSLQQPAPAAQAPQTAQAPAAPAAPGFQQPPAQQPNNPQQPTRQQTTNAPEKPKKQKSGKGPLIAVIAVLGVLLIAGAGLFIHNQIAGHWLWESEGSASSDDDKEDKNSKADNKNNKDNKDSKGNTEGSTADSTAEAVSETLPPQTEAVSETLPPQTEPVTQPNIPQPAGPEKVGNADLRFSVDGFNITWPPATSRLTADKGWERAEDDDVLPDTVLQPGEVVYDYYGNEDAYVVLIVEYWNNGNSPRTVKECGVALVSVCGGVLYSEPDMIPSDVGLARGTTSDSTEQEIIDAFGMPDEQHSIYYEEYDVVEDHVIYYCGDYAMHFIFTGEGVMTNLVFCDKALVPDFNNY